MGDDQMLYSQIAVVDGADNYQEAAIILTDPPIQIMGQRAAPTVVLRPLKQSSGRCFYECETNSGGYMQLGWADNNFKATADTGKGAGDDCHSWAFDGYRVFKWHNNKKEAYGKKWNAGDTIGIAVDLEQGDITFYINGECLGIAFHNIKFSEALYPAISLCRGERVTLRLGLTEKDAFKFPLKGFSALSASVASEPIFNKFATNASIIKMGMSDKSFLDSFPGEIMVNIMGRGLDYEAKKNGMINAGYDATLRKFNENESDILRKTETMGLTRNEIFAIICYTLEKPPVYQYFNKDTRQGFRGDGNDFPILNYLLAEGCKKILKSMQKDKRSCTVYRGVSIPFTADVGETIRFGAYTSTSANPKKAEEFQKNPSGTCFVINTKLGASVQMLSAYPEEEEVLLPPFEVFRVTKIEGVTKVIYCESQTSDEYLETYLK